jgi:hypothetical protein
LAWLDAMNPDPGIGVTARDAVDDGEISLFRSERLHGREDLIAGSCPRDRGCSAAVLPGNAVTG